MGCARGAPCGRRWGGSDGVEARARGLLYTTHLLRRRPAYHRPADRWSGQRRALARPPAGSSLGLLRALAPSAPSFRVPSCARSCWNETGWAGPGGPQQRGFIYPRENRVEAKRWSAGALALRQEWERRGWTSSRKPPISVPSFVFPPPLSPPSSLKQGILLWRMQPVRSERVSACPHHAPHWGAQTSECNDKARIKEVGARSRVVVTSPPTPSRAYPRACGPRDVTSYSGPGPSEASP